MIERARDKNAQFLETRYAIDTFHNPYLSKFTLKLEPNTANIKSKNAHFLSPFDVTHNIYISQSLPIYKSQKFRTSLIWKQYLKNKLGRAFIGLSSEYKADNNWTVKTRIMTGSSFLCNLQAIKKLQNQAQVMTFYHGMYDNSLLNSVLGVGIKRKQLSATLHKRFEIDYNFICQYIKPIGKDFLLTLKSQSMISEDLNANSLAQYLSLSLDYYFSNAIKASIGVVNQLGEKEVNVKLQIEKSTKTLGNFLCSVQYKNNASILSLGYKNPTFNIAMPVFLIESPLPTLIGTALYVAGYFLRQSKISSAEIIQQKKKDEQTRINELRLISDKANLNYEKQIKNPQTALLIDEAYVGTTALLDKLLESQDLGLALLRDNQLKDNIFDITVCMRFYVVKGELKLKRGDKTHLIGFYCKNTDDQIVIKYSKGGEKKTIRTKMTDQVSIK